MDAGLDRLDKWRATLPKHEQIQSDLLCNAFEGGSNYWYLIDRYQYPNGVRKLDFPHVEAPLKGGYILIKADGHRNPRREDGLWVLNHDSLQQGWKLMEEQYPRHYANAITEDHDAETGDVFLQLALFGELVFG